MDSYDNDGLLLFLDDDLFPIEDDKDVDTIQPESPEIECWRLHSQSDLRCH